jgi:hypothetical protein
MLSITNRYKDIAASHSLPLLHSPLALGLTYNLSYTEYVDYIPVNGYCVISIVAQLAQTPLSKNIKEYNY